MNTATSEFKGHTPGPWSTNGRYVRPCEHYEKAQPGSLYVADAIMSASYRPSIETEANARLLAAAPQLLRERDRLLEQVKQALLKFCAIRVALQQREPLQHIQVAIRITEKAIQDMEGCCK